MKTLLFTFTFLLTSVLLYGQEDKILYQQGPIEISHEFTFVKAKSKNDVYNLVVTLRNTGDTDFYYAVPRERDKNGAMTLPSTANKIQFAEVSITNATGIYTSKIYLKTKASDIELDDNSVLFLLPAGATITEKMNINIRSGIVPEAKYVSKKKLSTIQNFDVKPSAPIIAGHYTSSCGNKDITLIYQKTPDNEMRLFEQLDNGTLRVWVMQNPNTYTLEIDNDYLFRYYHKGNKITYIEPNGMACTWVRK